MAKGHSITRDRAKGKGWYKVSGKSVFGLEKAVTTARDQALGPMMAALTHTREEFARRAGFQYEGNRDIYLVAGYVAQGSEKFDDYWSYYDRDGIAARIVDLAPRATWKIPPVISEEGMDPDEGTKFTNAVTELADRLKLWSRMERVDRLSRIGRYGVLLIGTSDLSDDAALRGEMGRLAKPEDVLYLSAFHEKSAKVQTLSADPADPRYGQPEEYSIALSSGPDGKGEARSPVHYSRVIHAAEDLLENEVYGRPALKRCLNPLFNLEKITAATAEAIWQQAVPTLTGTLPEDQAITPAELKELGEGLEDIVHDLRRQFLSRGVELKYLETQIPDSTGAADLYLMLLAAAGDIPKRILFGTETGERASEQDERQWLGSIKERQIQHAEPNLLRPFIDQLVLKGALPTPKDGYDVIWAPLFTESEKEVAEANLSRAETAKALTSIGGDPMALVEVDEDRNVWLTPTTEGGEGDGEEEEEDVDRIPLPEGGPEDDIVVPDDEELEEV